MNETQPNLLEDTPLPNGTVSANCQLMESEGLHIVLVKGVEMFV